MISPRIFFYEPGTRKFSLQPESGKCLHGRSDSPSVKWKLFALEENHVVVGAFASRVRRRAARRSAADDSDVVNGVRHAAINVASLSRKQTAGGDANAKLPRDGGADAQAAPSHITWLKHRGSPIDPVDLSQTLNLSQSNFSAFRWLSARDGHSLFPVE